MARVRFGWLGPAIVIAGAGVAAVGIWYAVHAKPIAGAVVDRIAIDASSTLVIRDESGGERNFVELWDGSTLRWQALVPHYIGSPGRPGVAWSPTAVTIRVDRSGRAEVFALSTPSGVKLRGFRLAVEHEPIHVEPSGPITLTDHARSYELVGGDGWHEVVGVDLSTGNALWKADLGRERVVSATVDGQLLRVVQATSTRAFDVATGREATTTLAREHR